MNIQGNKFYTQKIWQELQKENSSVLSESSMKDVIRDLKNSRTGNPVDEILTLKTFKLLNDKNKEEYSGLWGTMKKVSSALDNFLEGKGWISEYTRMKNKIQKQITISEKAIDEASIPEKPVVPEQPFIVTEIKPAVANATPPPSPFPQMEPIASPAKNANLEFAKSVSAIAQAFILSDEDKLIQEILAKSIFKVIQGTEIIQFSKLGTSENKEGVVSDNYEIELREPRQAQLGDFQISAGKTMKFRIQSDHENSKKVLELQDGVTLRKGRGWFSLIIPHLSFTYDEKTKDISTTLPIYGQRMIPRVSLPMLLEKIRWAV